MYGQRKMEYFDDGFIVSTSTDERTNSDDHAKYPSERRHRMKKWIWINRRIDRRIC